jgi:hypothetical protein
VSDSTPTQLCFSPFAGFTARAGLKGGALSSDFGPLLLRGADQQIGLIHRVAQAIGDRRHASYISQIACGDADANDADV